MLPTTIQQRPPFLAGGGEMGQLTRDYDWSATSLGQPDQWPQSLKTTLGLLLHSAFPMFLWWGDELLCFYNDAYRPSLGNEGKHPALGKPARVVWPETWDFISPLIDQVRSTGQAVWFEDQLVPIYRNGQMEDVYWTFSYSPAYDDAGQIGGILVTCVETTGAVVARQRISASEARLRSIVEQTPAPMLVLRGDDFMLDQVNEPMLALIGRGKDIVGKSLLSIMPELEREFAWEQAQRVYWEGISYDGTGMLVQHVLDGALVDRYYNLAYRPLKENGRVTGVIQVVTDVTQQVHDRRAVDESEARYRSFIEAAPAAIALFRGPQFVIELANDEVLRFWGRRREQVMGKPLFEALPETSGQGFEELMMGVYSTGERFVASELPVTLERRGRLEQTFINFVYEPYREADGTISGITVVCVEVTEQVLARRKIEESEAQYRSLIEEAPVATALYAGPDLVIDVANEAMVRFYGKGSSILGKPAEQVLGDTDAERAALQLLQHVFATGQPFQTNDAPAVLTVEGVTGTYYFDLSLKPLRTATGEVRAILQTAIDVTQQVLARQQVQEAEETLRGAIKVADMGAWQLDLITGRTTYDEKLKELFEFTDLYIERDRLYNPIIEHDRARLEAAVIRAANPALDGLLDEEYTIVTQRTGRHRRVRAQAKMYFSADGQPRKMVGIMRDITEQRELQLALEQLVQQRTEELSAANEELSESNHLLLRSNDNLQKFAYVASHDLQEPLRKIQSFGDMLKDQYGTELGDGVDLLTRMQSAAKRMSILIRDLLNFSRISTQREANASVPLNDIVNNVLMDLELAITDNSAVIEVGPLPTVQGDALQLGQLFQNLISNALKFRHADVPPRITISSQLVAAGAVQPTAKPSRTAAAYHRIDVTDNGIGFDLKYVDRIFQVFQRLHSRSNFVGTGIGLAICEKVATNHGGAITAHSHPGQGATFSVYLPQ